VPHLQGAPNGGVDGLRIDRRGGRYTRRRERDEGKEAND
jgi:hypothetical protein